jgi:hypothetical protein
MRRLYGHQPRVDELSKGYPVRQTVDLQNLKVPKSLGTAAVTPRPSNAQVPTSPKSKQ